MGFDTGQPLAGFGYDPSLGHPQAVAVGAHGFHTGDYHQQYSDYDAHTPNAIGMKHESDHAGVDTGAQFYGAWANSEFPAAVAEAQTYPFDGYMDSGNVDGVQQQYTYSLEHVRIHIP